MTMPFKTGHWISSQARDLTCFGSACLTASRRLAAFAFRWADRCSAARPSRVESERAARIRSKKDKEEHEQRDVVEICAEVAPPGRVMSRSEPCSERERQHVHRAAEGSPPYPEA